MIINKNEIEKLSKLVLENAEPLKQNNYKVLLAKNITNRIMSDLLL